MIRRSYIPERIDTINITPEYYTPEEVSRRVIRAVLEIVEAVSEEQGMGIAAVEEAIVNVFSDVVEVETSDDSDAVITVRRRRD